jgi:hypothetical protein
MRMNRHILYILVHQKTTAGDIGGPVKDVYMGKNEIGGLSVNVLIVEVFMAFIGGNLCNPGHTFHPAGQSR